MGMRHHTASVTSGCVFFWSEHYKKGSETCVRLRNSDGAKTQRGEESYSNGSRWTELLVQCSNMKRFPVENSGLYSMSHW
ncbi:hypothetical protein AB6A40_004746 [Gnathostoma spinigerum]|uniref:Uncharacterized protein n=1 Tax=Gnathostoma spinigerum TaxID=75299 RepID=A0ABD6EN95_9BILA